MAHWSLFITGPKFDKFREFFPLGLIHCFVSMQEHLTVDDARQQFLRILRALPYGNSVFFSVRKIDDPIGLLPGRIVLGINKRGVSHKLWYTIARLLSQVLSPKNLSQTVSVILTMEDE